MMLRIATRYPRPAPRFSSSASSRERFEHGISPTNRCRVAASRFYDDNQAGDDSRQTDSDESHSHLISPTGVEPWRQAF